MLIDSVPFSKLSTLIVNCQPYFSGIFVAVLIQKNDLGAIGWNRSIVLCVRVVLFMYAVVTNE